MDARTCRVHARTRIALKVSRTNNINYLIFDLRLRFIFGPAHTSKLGRCLSTSWILTQCFCSLIIIVVVPFFATFLSRLYIRFTGWRWPQEISCPNYLYRALTVCVCACVSACVRVIVFNHAHLHFSTIIYIYLNIFALCFTYAFFLSETYARSTGRYKKYPVRILSVHIHTRTHIHIAASS